MGTAQHDGNAMHVFDARKDANASVKSIVLGARKGGKCATCEDLPPRCSRNGRFSLFLEGKCAN